MNDKTTEQPIPSHTKEFAAIKSALGQIFWDFIAMSKDGKSIEGNPAVHRMAEWVYDKLHSLLPSPVGEAVAFANWIWDNDYEACGNEPYWTNDNDTGKTTDELYKLFKADRPTPSRAGEAEKLTIQDYKEALDDKNRLTRDIDIIINGDNAAKQASLCDLIGQIEDLVRMRDHSSFEEKCVCVDKIGDNAGCTHPNCSRYAKRAGEISPALPRWVKATDREPPNDHTKDLHIRFNGQFAHIFRYFSGFFHRKDINGEWGKNPIDRHSAENIEWLEEAPPTPAPEEEKKPVSVNYYQAEAYCKTHSQIYFGRCPKCPPPIITTSSTAGYFETPAPEVKEEQESLSQRMKRFFAEVPPEQILAEWKELGYEFEDVSSAAEPVKDSPAGQEWLTIEESRHNDQWHPQDYSGNIGKGNRLVNPEAQPAPVPGPKTECTCICGPTDADPNCAWPNCFKSENKAEIPEEIIGIVYDKIFIPTKNEPGGEYPSAVCDFDDDEQVWVPGDRFVKSIAGPVAIMTAAQYYALKNTISALTKERDNLIASVESWEGKYHQAEAQIVSLNDQLKAEREEKGEYREALENEAKWLGHCVQKKRIEIVLNKYPQPDQTTKP